MDLSEVDQPAILVVTDMQIVPTSRSRYAWSVEATKSQIDELFCILSHGYSSNRLPFNTPLTISGKFACIDTEHPQRKLPLHRAGNFLSDEMREYWEQLVRTGGEALVP
jgi:hypothetical protein